MPALDYCHPQFVRALQKDDWLVKEKPEQFRVTGRIIFIDISASRGTNGLKRQALFAEIKCFPDLQSTSRELYIAIGQYIVYRAVLAELQDTTLLYLAVPESVYQTVFDVAVRRAISDNQIKMVIVNLETETITQWIE